MSTNEVLGSCGVLCSACPDFTEKNCRCYITPEGGRPCNLFLCAERKGVKVCGECPDFPCEDISEFYKESPGHMEAFERMKAMRK